MNHALITLYAESRLADEPQRPLRYAFAYACADRVRHRLEQPRAVELLDVLRDYVAGDVDEAALQAASDEAQLIANQHRGSPSIDGSQHSAVSATYAVAKALAGKALEAADYAAYSTVYGYGGYAVNDPDAFASEHAWQVAALKALLARADVPSAS